MYRVEMYTDGACSGNPGPGGWGVLLRHKDIEKELSGGASETTNNRMELTAVIEGLKALKKRCDITLYTDSKYVMPDEKADHEMEIGVTFTGTIEPAEVVEYYNFVNSTSAGAFVDELGLVISKIKIGRDDTFGSDESHEQVDWNDAELFTHYESNRLDQSKSRSTSTVEYNLYFN